MPRMSVYSGVRYIVDPTAYLLPFEFTVDTTKSGVSGSTQFQLPLIPSGMYSFIVDWGDGNQDRIVSYNQAETLHTYGTGGVKTISILGKCRGWQFNNGGDKLKITDISQWGDGLRLGTNDGAYFYGCANLRISATDAPDLSNTTSLSRAFSACTVFNDSINHWNVSGITDMYAMFFGCAAFNQSLNSWNVGNVTDMRYMFRYCVAFNGNIESWDVSNVTSMVQMFDMCIVFNQPLNSWDVSKVTNMYEMFMNCNAFNQNLNSWDTGSVTNMGSMFCYCNAFNGNIGSWDVSSVTSMFGMFQDCYVFNQDIGSWNVGNVTNMSNMFTVCPAFNQDLGSWDVSKVTDMSSMFNSCGVFNQSLNSWNVGSVTIMNNMFYGCEAFNGNITSWDVSKVTNMGSMFGYCSAFNQDISSWNTANVTLMYSMFANCYIFNGNIGSWDVSKVTNMSSMFEYCYAFNQNLNSWNTANVTSMGSMFTECHNFNGNISAWNTGKVTDMAGMFYRAYTFDQDITGWDVSKVTGFYSIFAWASSFKQDISLWSPTSVVADGSNFDGTWGLLRNNDINAPGTTTRLDSLFTSWAGKSLPNNLKLRAGSSTKYSFAGAAGRATLISKGWTIVGDLSADVTFSNSGGHIQGTYSADTGTGTRVKFTTNGSLPTGLTAGVDYWTIRIASTTAKYATSLANALSGIPINYTDSGSGTHAMNQYAWKFAASNSSGKLLLTLNGSQGELQYSGRKVRFVTDNTLPTGLVAGQDYYLDRISAATYQVANSPSEAVGHLNLINWTDAGTGNHELVLQG